MIAVISDADNTRVVVTDGPTADADLQRHIKAAKPDAKVLILDHKDYEAMSSVELVSRATAEFGVSTLQPLNPSPLVETEAPEKTEARKAAVIDAIGKGKSYLEAMQAGQDAVDVMVATMVDGDAGGRVL